MVEEVSSVGLPVDEVLTIKKNRILPDNPDDKNKIRSLKETKFLVIIKHEKN